MISVMDYIEDLDSKRTPANTRHTTVRLKSGIMVCNFSSTHDFTFDDGTILPGVSEQTSKLLTLSVVEHERANDRLGTTDVALTWCLPPFARRILFYLAEEMEAQRGFILCPLPVMQCLLGELENARGNGRGCDAEMILDYARGVRMADRIKKISSSTKFCIMAAE